MRFLKQNTATRVTVGPFMDKTDGVTPETALTVTNCKLTLMVDDGGVPTLVLDAAATASAGNNDMVHVTNDDAGFYDLELTAAQTNYVGRAMLSITDAATHCPVFHEFMILPANVYDSLMGTDYLDVSAVQFAGQTITCEAGVTIRADVGAAATPGAANGMFIAGTNAPVTITGSGNALTLTSTGADGSGLVASGNGNGHGISATGGVGLASWDIYSGGNGIKDIQDMITNYVDPILSDTGELQTDWANGGRLDLLIDAIKAKTDLAVINTTWTDAKAEYIDAAISSRGTGTALDATGVRGAVGLAAANLDAQIAAVVGYIDTEVAAILAAVDTEVAAIKAKTDNLPADPADQSAVETAILSLLTTQMTESYNATGVAPTVAQALFVIMQRLTEFGITGTTIGVKKLDRVASAYSLTTDDATNPTSSTRTP